MPELVLVEQWGRGETAVYKTQSRRFWHPKMFNLTVGGRSVSCKTEF